VISTLTAAQMRKMMEGVVLEGTGKAAQLNGYSAAGKTGTAEKIDPRTHTYSKTKYVASFVGFAPVNDPAITMVIVMDSPQASMHYGASASAPMFHELAQQILEYLGVPHDQDIKTTVQMAAVESQPAVEEEPAEHIDDLNSLFDEVNHLPADDPLRIKQDAAALLPLSKTDTGVRPVTNSNAAAERASVSAPDMRLPAPQNTTDDNGATPIAPQKDFDSSPALPPSPIAAAPKGSVTVGSGKGVAVPSLIGEPVRAVIENAGAAGLGVQVVGSGIARQQVPAAGTMVPTGTEIVVQFGR
jgi:cell division protein FtsI (penicillin-binding protein 3)